MNYAFSTNSENESQNFINVFLIYVLQNSPCSIRYRIYYIHESEALGVFNLQEVVEVEAIGG